jgi:hypothetical protein
MERDYTKEKPTPKQLGMINYIQSKLVEKFSGESAQDAYDFIGKFYAAAKEQKNTEGVVIRHKSTKIAKPVKFRQKSKLEEYAEYLDSINAHPSDYGVPNY